MPYPPDKEEPFRLLRDRTALLVVDMQNDFVRAGAPLEVPDARDTIAAHRELIGRSRHLGIPVLFTKFLAGPAYTLVWEWSPVLGPETKCCWKNHRRHYLDVEGARDGSEIIDEIAPHESDAIIEKFGYSAFHDASTASRLASLGRDMLIVTGTVTQICVEDSVRSAFHHGFRTVVARDAVSSFDRELHEASLRGLAAKYARVLTNGEIFKELSSAQAGQTPHEDLV